LNWARAPGTNAFKIPAQALFDPSGTSSQPKLGFLIAGLAVLAFLLVVANAPRWLSFMSGAVCLGGAGLYAYRIQRLLAGLGHASFTEVLGPGPWITAIAAAVLMASAMLYGAQHPRGAAI
jgi:hypothetical protein